MAQTFESRSQTLIGKILNGVSIMVLLSIIVIVTIFGVKTVRVSGQSMDNTLHDGTYGVSIAYKPNQTHLKQNDIIIFDGTKEDPNDERVANKAKHTEFIKRVIALPGQSVKFDGANIYVDDKKISQPYLTKKNHTVGSNSMDQLTWDLHSLSTQNSWEMKDKNTTVVPKNSYFVMGDNRAESEDSRYFGYVEQSNIIAKLIVHQ